MDNTILVDESSLDLARTLCSVIEEQDIRDKAVENAFAAKISKNFFPSLDIDTLSGLHNNPIIQKYLDIADIYVNNLRLDVRMVFDNESLKVPKSHYDKGVLPFAYMFIRMDKSLQQGEVIGFLPSNKINFLEEETDFCTVLEESLLDYSQFDEYIINDAVDNLETDNSNLDYALFDFVDNKLDEAEIDKLLRALFVNKEARLKLFKILSINNAYKSFPSTDNNYTIPDNVSVENNLSENVENALFDIETLIESTPEVNLKEDTNQNEENILVTSSKDDKQIEVLFEETFENEGTLNTNDLKYKKRKFLPIIGIMAVLLSLAYWGYNNFQKSEELPSQKIVEQPRKDQETTEKVDEMPIETVENIKPEQKAITAVASNNDNVAIPVIEKNLGASISISNLTVKWEVPNNYLNNLSVQKYLIKLGKIIQLNLKTELLLLSELPMTNNIKLELTFDAKTNKLKIKNFITSSGDKSIDKIIEKAVDNVLQMELKFSTKALNELSENIVLNICL